MRKTFAIILLCAFTFWGTGIFSAAEAARHIKRPATSSTIKQPTSGSNQPKPSNNGGPIFSAK